MAAKTKLGGYWISCVDEGSAKAAIKMAGLPVLVMGGNAALAALIAFSQPSPNINLTACYAAISLPLFILAFRIRAEKSGWIPLVLVLFAAFVAIKALVDYISLVIVGGGVTSIVQVVISWIVALICCVLVIAGFKGWLWLKANGLPRPF